MSAARPSPELLVGVEDFDLRDALRDTADQIEDAEALLTRLLEVRDELICLAISAGATAGGVALEVRVPAPEVGRIASSVPSRERRKIADRVRQEVYERDDFKCLACGREDSLSLDHVTPVSMGGGNERGNLQTLCMACNLRKRTGTTDYRPHSG